MGDGLTKRMCRDATRLLWPFLWRKLSQVDFSLLDTMPADRALMPFREVGTGRGLGIYFRICFA